MNINTMIRPICAGDQVWCQLQLQLITITCTSGICWTHTDWGSGT